MNVGVDLMLPHPKIIVAKIVHVIDGKVKITQMPTNPNSNQDGNAEPFDGFSRFGTQDSPCSVDTALTLGIVVVSNPRGVKSIPILIGLMHAR